MGGICNSKGYSFVPLGFNITDGDRFVAMCNEVVYYKNQFNIDGTLYTTGTGPKDYLTSFIGNHTISWLKRVALEAAASSSSSPSSSFISSPPSVPFFAYVAPHAPHFPAEPAPWYKNAPLPAQHQRVPRVPSYNSSVDGKSWAIRINPAFSSFTSAGIDTHYRNRLRTLLSVDDLVDEIFLVLEEAGVLNNTYVITTSDHGYHLGNFRVPFEKAMPYDTDIRVPFYMRGPGIRPGSSQPALVSLMDVGATILELAGVDAPGTRSTEGRSLVPLLFDSAGGSEQSNGAGADAVNKAKRDVGQDGNASAGNVGMDKVLADSESVGHERFRSTKVVSHREQSSRAEAWRDMLLVEFMGFPNQWMDMCHWVYNYTACPAPASIDLPYLINGPQNTYTSIRIMNRTADLTYAEYRPTNAPLAPASTNWTEAYDLQVDPWQLTNVAVSGSSMPPHVLQALKEQLWAVATCTGDACP